MNFGPIYFHALLLKIICKLVMSTRDVDFKLKNAALPISKTIVYALSKQNNNNKIERIHRSPAEYIVKGNVSEWKTVRQTLSKFGPSLTSILRPFQDNVKVHY